MALGKYSRIDDKKSSSSYCSTVTSVIFVALCLVGVWMMTSSSVVIPVQNSDDVPPQESQSELKTQVTESNETNDSNNGSNENGNGINEIDNGSNDNSSSSSESGSGSSEIGSGSNDSSGGSNDSGSGSNDSSGDSNESNNGSNENNNDSNESNNRSNESNNVSSENTSVDEARGKPFEDNPGNLPADATKKDNDSTQDAKTTGENQEEIEVKSKEEKKDEPKFEDGSKGASSNGEMNKENEEPKGEYKDSEAGDKTENNKSGEGVSEVNKSNANDDAEKKPEETFSDMKDGDKESGKIEEKADDKKDQEGFNQIQDIMSPIKSPLPSDVPIVNKENVPPSDVPKTNEEKLLPSDAPKIKEENSKIEDHKGSSEKNESLNLNEMLPSVAQSELLNETNTQNGAFLTQATQSKKEKIAKKSFDLDKGTWKLCNVTAGPDYIPCLDNLDAIKHLRTTMHYEHRERHCPDEAPTCLVSLPKGYQRPIKWPTSREKIWYHNVPHTKLAAYKGHQNWVKANGEYLTFPGGGTQFTHGALHYIDIIQQSVPEIAWGKRSRVVLDVGCGVASFGGFLFDRDVLTMSFAPKDEHEAQVQFALERGIPAISAVMGTTRLPFPSRVFDVVHCARCRVPWHIEGGKLLLELNRMLRPGGFFVWSATPVYRKGPEDVKIWEGMKNLTKSMCWDLVKVTKDKLNKVGIAIFKKPSSNECYEQRSQDDPPLCRESDDPNAAWNVPLQSCMHKVPTSPIERGSRWPELWPARLEKSPYWLQSSQMGVYGKPAPEDFAIDYQHWKRVVTKTYLNAMGIDWSTVRNVLDMRAVYGGFAAALKELNVWVMNVISVDAPDTLPVIYERGLFGIYHDWCESFSTYPRSYDLLHADHLFSKIKTKCGLPPLVVEVDRILRPKGKLIIRDDLAVISELQTMLKSMHYEIHMSYSRDKEGLLCVKKTNWRPTEVETLAYAIDEL